MKGDLNVVGKVTGINISDVTESALYLDESATISGRFSFGNISIDNVDVAGTFGGIHPSEVVTTDREEMVYGRKRFVKTRFEAEHKENIHVSKLLNRINTDDMLTVDGDQNITANYIFNDTAVVMGNMTVTDTINGEVFSRLVEDTVMINRSGTSVSARKLFNKMHILGDLNMRVNFTVNAVDVSELLKIGIHLNLDRFNSEVTFASDVTFRSNVTVGGTVNGLNLSDVVFTDVDSVIVASKVIIGDVRSTASIHVNGKINNINLKSKFDLNH